MPALTIPRSTVLYPAAILLLGLAAYGSGLDNGFTFDDYAVVVNNPVVTEGRLSEVFTTGYWRGQASLGHFRPLTILTFILNHSTGGLEPFGYHLTNIVLHLLNATLLFWILYYLLRDPHGAGFGALLFLLHPANTEAVASIVGRSELLSALFVLLAWACYIAASRMAGQRQSALLFASVATALLAGLAKEQAAALVGLLVGYDLLLLLRGRNARPVRTLIRHDLVRYTPFILVAGLVALLRYNATGAFLLPDRPSFIDNHLAHLDTWPRVLSAVTSLGHYAAMLVFPHPLSADYAYNAIPAVTTIWSLPFLGSVGVCTGAAALLLAGLRGRVAPEAGLGVLVIGLFLIPVSNLFFAVGTRFAERLLYLPSAGFCLLLSYGFTRIRRISPRAFAGIGALLLLAAGAAVRARVPDWHDNRTLFTSAVVATPENARAHFNQGNAFRESGDLDATLKAYDRALQIYPDYAEVHYNRGVIFQQAGRTEAAASAYASALASDSTHASTWVNLGTLLGRLGQSAQAVRALDRARRLRPDDVRVLYNYGLACQQAGLREEAVRAYQSVLDARPDHVDAALNLGALYDELGYTAETISVYRRALRERPTAYRLAYNLGVLQERLGGLDEAIQAYARAAKGRNERGAYALYRKAELHRQLGEAAAARQAYSEFLARWDKADWHKARAERQLKLLSPQKR